MKTVSLIGSTGSIGRQVLSVIRRHSDRYKLESIVSNASAELFLQQVREFQPRYAALVDEEAGKAIVNQIPSGVRFGYGKQAALEAIAYGEVAFVAASGFAGLEYSLSAIAQGKDLALANKETLVCGGELVMRNLKGAGTRLMPVDSEHSALWQALSFRTDAPFRRLIITASGGPFYAWSKQRLAKVTPADALKHPTWNMGAKITIDSATLLNKGLEVIEAKWLYDCPIEKIHTVVHPESIIHSMVEFEDCGILAQMSYPTMELPIQLALSYPQRLELGLKPLDFEQLGALHFKPLRREDFPCYDLALKSLEMGDNYSCVMNGAGEVAVHAFLRGEIPFTAIAEVIAFALEKAERLKPSDLQTLLFTDEQARAYAKKYIKERILR